MGIIISRFPPEVIDIIDSYTKSIPQYILYASCVTSYDTIQFDSYNSIPNGDINKIKYVIEKIKKGTGKYGYIKDLREDEETKFMKDRGYMSFVNSYYNENDFTVRDIRLIESEAPFGDGGINCLEPMLEFYNKYCIDDRQKELTKQFNLETGAFYKELNNIDNEIDTLTCEIDDNSTLYKDILIQKREEAKPIFDKIREIKQRYTTEGLNEFPEKGYIFIDDLQ